MSRWRKPLLLSLALLAALALAAVIGFQLALRELQAAVLAGLGPRATLAGLQIDQGGVELRGLRIAAIRTGSKAWPAEDELRAERVRLVPQWRAFWTAALAGDKAVWRIARIEVDGGYVSVLRTRQGGLRVLPALLEPRPQSGGGAAAPDRRIGQGGIERLFGIAGALAAAPSAAPASGASAASAASAAPLALLIGKVVLREVAVDFFDASIARAPHRLQLTQLQAELRQIAWPGLDQPVPISLRARLKGLDAGAAAGSRDGEVNIDGSLTPATRDAQLKARLRGVDLRVLQPYLLGVSEGGIRRGLLDLDLDASVHQQRLRAPGTVVLTQLELGDGPGAFGRFAGVPQQLVLAAMRRQGRIELRFTLEGRLDDPAFSINENLATRLAVGLAEALGVSVGGAVEGLGSLLKGLFGR